MSISREIKVACPKCGKESTFKIWKSLNTSINPEMKEKVLSREMFRFVCPECGTEAEIDHPLLYHQMEDKIMIYYVQDEEGFREAEKVFNGEAYDDGPEQEPKALDGYLRRIVASQNDLIEKIRVFDDGWDDRIIEIMKVVFIDPVAKENPDLGIFTLYYDGNKDKIRFVIINEETTCGSFDAPEGMYEDLVEKLAENMMDIREEENFTIDFNWAAGMLMRGEGELS